MNSLGSLQQLRHVFLDSNHCLVMHCEDLREFYHAFLIEDQRRVRNALKATFRPADLRHLDCYSSALDDCEWVVPALNTMAMGDCNSVAFGQCSHLSVLLRTGEFCLEDFISLRGRPSRKGWLAGLMIDDFILLEQVNLKEQNLEDTPGKRKVQKVREMYDRVGLPRHSGKAVSSSLKAEFWGGETNGETGLVTPNAKRMIPLVHIMLKIVQLRVCSVSLLEVLCGSLVSAFQLTRRFMAALEELYAAQRNRARSDIIALSPQLIDEILVCIGLVTITKIDMRMKPSPMLVCSDASNHAEAAVATSIWPHFTKEADRYAPSVA